MYDLIGDIHGHSDELVQLLELLGYSPSGGVYRHPERKVIFLGDFIDRGPKIREALETVRPMVEAGHALAVMGNHEFNALAYHTEDSTSPGEFLRKHTEKNRHQHSRTVEQLSSGDLRTHLEWFRTLPLWLELEGLRAVHACWSGPDIDAINAALNQYGGLTSELLQSACGQGKPLFEPVEVVLKGREAPLPDERSFLDKDGHSRHSIRTRWYLPPDGQSYRSYALQADAVECDLPLTSDVQAQAVPYPADAKPVFVGHYWLSGIRPEILAPNVACLDYSVAKGGLLCGYRWNGEATLSNDNFVWVGDQ